MVNDVLIMNERTGNSRRGIALTGSDVPDGDTAIVMWAGSVVAPSRHLVIGLEVPVDMAAVGDLLTARFAVGTIGPFSLREVPGA